MFSSAVCFNCSYVLGWPSPPSSCTGNPARSCFDCGLEIPENSNFGDCPATVRNGESCAPDCDAGYYRSGDVSCNSGRLTKALCISCEKDGHFCPQGATFEEACPSGRYGNGAAYPNGDCEGPCAPGRYGNGTGYLSDQCEGPCAPGRYGNGSGYVNDQCEGPCAPGHYGNGAGYLDDQCEGRCDDESYCPAGSTSKAGSGETCPDGYTCNSTTSAALLCAAGSFCAAGNIGKSSTSRICCHRAVV